MTDAGHILLVEDDDDLRPALKITFEQRGFDVTACGDGAEALDYLEASVSPPDLIVLDLLLPDVDGFDVLRRMGEMGDRANIPVIVLTGVDSDQRLTETFELGADDYVTKPFSPNELISRANRLMN